MTTSPEILQAALEGLEAKLANINAMIVELKGSIGPSQPGTPGRAVVKRGKRTVSPETRKRMAKAQRKRWANQ